MSLHQLNINLIFDAMQEAGGDPNLIVREMEKRYANKAERKRKAQRNKDASVRIQRHWRGLMHRGAKNLITLNEHLRKPMRATDGGLYSADSLANYVWKGCLKHGKRVGNWNAYKECKLPLYRFQLQPINVARIGTFHPNFMRQLSNADNWNAALERSGKSGMSPTTIKTLVHTCADGRYDSWNKFRRCDQRLRPVDVIAETPPRLQLSDKKLQRRFSEVLRAKNPVRSRSAYSASRSRSPAKKQRVASRS